MTKRKSKSQSGILKTLALSMALNCVRNTVIETYHGEGKLSDDEMMAFNKEVADKLYTYLTFMFGPDSPGKEVFLRIMTMMYPDGWDEPVLDKDMMDGIKIALGEKRAMKRSG